MLRVQQRATKEMMKAMMTMMRPMIISAATAWAHAGERTKKKTFNDMLRTRFITATLMYSNTVKK